MWRSAAGLSHHVQPLRRSTGSVGWHLQLEVLHLQLNAGKHLSVAPATPPWLLPNLVLRTRAELLQQALQRLVLLCCCPTLDTQARQLAASQAFPAPRASCIGVLTLQYKRESCTVAAAGSAHRERQKALSALRIVYIAAHLPSSSSIRPGQ
jgi:hypothetical protein